MSDRVTAKYEDARLNAALRAKSIPCELCSSNIVRGIVHKIHGVYVCDGCQALLEKSKGIYHDGNEVDHAT